MSKRREGGESLAHFITGTYYSKLANASFNPLQFFFCAVTWVYLNNFKYAPNCS